MTAPEDQGPRVRLTRNQARAQGLKAYTAAFPCSRDHEPLRRVYDGRCLGCLDAQRGMVARAAGRIKEAALAQARREVEREQAAAQRQREREAEREAHRLAKEAKKQAERKARAKATRQARKAANEAGKGPCCDCSRGSYGP